MHICMRAYASAIPSRSTLNRTCTDLLDHTDNLARLRASRSQRCTGNSMARFRRALLMQSCAMTVRMDFGGPVDHNPQGHGRGPRWTRQSRRGQKRRGDKASIARLQLGEDTQDVKEEVDNIEIECDRGGDVLIGREALRDEVHIVDNV